MEKLEEKKEEKIEKKQEEYINNKKTNHNEKNKIKKEKKKKSKKAESKAIKEETSKDNVKEDAAKKEKQNKAKDKQEEKVKETEKKEDKEKNNKKEIKNNNKKKDIIIIITIVIASLIVIALTGYSLCVQQVNQNIDFRLIGNENIELEVGTEYEEQGIIANCNSTDLSKKVSINSNLDVNKIGNYQIEYNIKNSFLHVDKTIYRNVLVKDTTAPKLTVEGEKEETIYVGDKFKTPKYTAEDNYDGDITDSVKVDSNVNTSKIGTYTVKYSVKDSSGNESTEKIEVKVKKKKNPYIVVSISKQTLKYYEYDRLVLSSNIVTGINGKTPTGTFKILNKARNIVLKGEDYASFVNYWIAFLRILIWIP